MIFLFRITVIFSAVFLCTGCGEKKGKIIEKPSEVQEYHAPSPAYGDTLVYSYVADIINLNPVLCNDGVSSGVFSYLFSGLVRYNENFSLEPDLCETWEVSEDGKNIQFKLKRNVFWHDNVPLTSGDIKFTYDKMIDPATGCPSRDYYEGFETLEILDDFNLIFRLKEPFAPALEYCNFNVIPEHIYGSEDFFNGPHNMKPVGSGPFRFLQWLPAEQVLLQAFEDYFEGRPYLNRFVSRVLPDKSMAFLLLKRGELDMYGLSVDQYEHQVKDNPSFSDFKLYFEANFYTYLNYNTKKPQLSDARVRRALTMSIDRDFLIREIRKGHGKHITGPFAPGSWPSDDSISPYPYDTEEAFLLFSQAGFSDSDGDGVLDREGEKLRIVITNFGSDSQSLLVPNLIRDFWKKAGVECEIEPLEWSAIMKKADAAEFDAVHFGRDLGGWDPDNEYGVWHSSQIPDPEKGKLGYNFSRYSNPEMDQALESGRKTYDQEKRKQYYHKVHQLLHRDQPCTFLFISEGITALHKRFHGVTVSDAGVMSPVRKWYVPANMQKY